MKFITFILTYPLIWCLSRLPMRVLYWVSNFLYLLIYYVIGYRKKVVENNIKIVFPEKSDEEIKLISKKFFKHFTDVVVESVKLFSISENEIKKRYVYRNIDVINNLAEEGRSIVLQGAHHNNWEWIVGLPLQAKIECYGTYKKLQNPYFEKVLKSTRRRFGFDGIITSFFRKNVENRVNNNIQSLYVLFSDQSPSVHKTKYWTTFLNEFVPVHTGAEWLAKKHNLAVVNMSVTKVKRGYYEIDFDLITDTPLSFDDYKITDEYLKLVEKQISKQPENYLWSHKRFKHKNEYDNWLKMDIK